jgi:uncharacterized protein (TIGR03437 family)
VDHGERRASPGLSLSTSGELSGTPTTAGTYTFLIEAADSSNAANMGFRQFTMTVTPIALTTATTLPYGNVGFPYSQALTATGGTGTLTWTLAPFNYLSPGLSLSSSGIISGTPTQTGQFQFTINVADAAGNPGSWALTISVFPAPVTSYVSSAGNDANAGGLAQPYLTIQKCATTVYGGSTCLIRAGTYPESVTPNSGITIMLYKGESVTIDGTDPVTGWTVYQRSIYSAPVAMSLADGNQVFVWNQMMTEASWPNGNDLFHVNWATAAAGTTTTQLVDPNLPNIDWTGATITFWSGPDPNSFETGIVSASSEGQLTYSLSSVPQCPQDGSPYGALVCPQPGGYYYLSGALGALDAPGEWFYDSTAHVLYFWAPGGVNPSSLGVYAKQRQYAFDLSGASNVTVEHVNIFASTINTDSSSTSDTLNGINASYVSHSTTLNDYPGSPSSFKFSQTLNTGIILMGSGDVLENSTIAFSAGNGVAVQGSNNTVKNNLIHHVDYMGTEAAGVYVAGPGHEIQNNTIYATGRSAIRADGTSAPGPTNNLDVSYNNIFNNMMLSYDAGGFYTYGYAVTSSEIHNNWFHDTHSLVLAPPGTIHGLSLAGVYLDDFSTGWTVDQNVIWNNIDNVIMNAGAGAGVISSQSAENNSVVNNTLPDVGSTAYIELSGIVNCGTTLVQDNLVLVPVNQTTTNPPCTAIDNNATAPGATEMTAGVQVGCNFAGCASSGPPTVLGTSVGPSIALQPLSATVAVGQTATFSVTAAGSPTFAYQWQRNGMNIPGATSASYTTAPTSFGDNGAIFSVQVSNPLGSVRSDPAVLVIGVTPVLAAVITGVANAEGGSTTIAPNTWVSISGFALAPVGDSRPWQGSDFTNGQMPSKLDGVSVSMNGENAYVYYISPGQINVLTPPDVAPGPVQVVVTSSGMKSGSFTAQAQATSPSFFIFGGGPYVVATHAEGSLIGPATLYPGLTTPASPGETIVLYANGFGPVSPPVSAGSATQVGKLPTMPTIQIGGTSASVQFAGLVSPGLFQFNIIVPAITANGDNALAAQYSGGTTQPAVLLTVEASNPN